MLVKTYRLRLYLLYIVPVLAMVGLISRLYYLQVVDQEKYQQLADAQHFDEYDIVPMRGKIFDTNGHELAGSVILDRAHVNIRQIPASDGELIPRLASDFARVLNNPSMGYDEIVRRLQGKVNKWPFLARDLSEEKKLELRQIFTDPKYDKSGVTPRLLDFVPENKRRYSRGSLAPHVVGFTQRDETGDNKGVYGVELTYNEELRGREESYIARKSATGNPMEPADPELVESTFGHSVKLTIDESLQAVTQNVLAQGVEKSRADGGVALCYAVKTGEVLAMASYPSFDLTNIAGASTEQRTNRALSHAIEPGSVMKIITFTSLFDDGLIEPFDTINCEGGTWHIPGTSRVVRDSSRDGVIPVSTIFQKSSNIGTIKAARAYTDYDRFYEHLKRFGFGERTGIDLPGESRGVLHNVRRWQGSSMVSLPMGYEIQLTAIQVVAAVGAIANNGIYMQPHVVKEIIDHTGKTVRKIEPMALRSVARPVACRKIVDLMELVVEKGTAKAAKLEGYRVGGKTGTTKKLNQATGKYYEKAYIASFCGIAPIEDPEICIYVYVDNPQGDKQYGGQVAAPVFREICREAMRVLRIPEKKNTMPTEDFRMTLDKVRNEIEGRVPKEIVNPNLDIEEEEEPSPDTVPNVMHKSLREAMQIAASVGMQVRVSGSGIVVEQDPPAHETIEGDRLMYLKLASAEEFISSEAEEYARLFNAEDEAQQVNAASIGFAEPVSSVPLSLDLGGENIPVPVFVGSGAILQGANPVTAQPGGPGRSLPDLDEALNGALSGTENSKSWTRYERELDELKKRRSEAELADVEEVAGSDNANAAVATGFPVPEIGSSDELNPEEDVVPLNIETPEELKKPRQPVKSWYDLQ